MRKLHRWGNRAVAAIALVALTLGSPSATSATSATSAGPVATTIGPGILNGGSSLTGSALFSSSALGGGTVPLDNVADGFLNIPKDPWEGAVSNGRSLDQSDLDFFSNGHLTAKFQGGGGSLWTGNEGNNTEVPEPGTLALIGGGLLARGRAARKKKQV